MSRSILWRMAPFITGRIQRNQRLLSSVVAQTSSLPESTEPVHMTDNCIRRLKELSAKQASSEGKMLRLSVEAGGCSGFQYSFALDNNKNTDDKVFEKDGVKLVIDSVSYDFVKGATVDYAEELIRSAFLVVENPSAVGGCSCKSSFMVK
ncbi:iron-sulfur cluster biosynthesis family protein [Carex rostrata]